jgi:SAM-dependent methyltransferase
MSFSLDDVAFLISDVGQRILADYATVDVSEARTLRLLSDLRKSLTLEQASAILTTLKLRQKAVDKFPNFAHRLLFTEDSLQQASDFHIRRYRAQSLTPRSVLDVCCSIGSDALAFAQAGHTVLGLDIDLVRIEIARYNASVMGLNAQFEVADVTQPIPDDYDLIFYDPARRTADGNRIFNIEQYIPPVSLIHDFQADEIAVKLSPAVDLAQLDAYGGQVEFVSVNGDLKEAVLWQKRETARPIATLISDKTYHFEHEQDLSVATTEPRGWLFEPDSSILRAGLVQNLATTLDATMLDPTIAYLTLDKHVLTPWGRYWRILDWMPFNLKKLRRYLLEHHVKNVTVKKRGFPMSPDEVIAKLKLKKGDESRVLVMTRLQGQPIVIICADI